LSTPDRAAGWTKPPRPDWVARLNAEGAGMDLRGVVPLDEDSLIRHVTRRTGLDDFGPDDWREPFRLYLSDLEEYAELTLMGRLMTRQDLLHILEARLLVERAYSDHPEIADERIVAPFYIIGQPRTGTSYLHNLLTADPDNGAVLQWEAMFPAPPPEAATYRSDPRIARAHHLISQWYRVTPELDTLHEFEAELPTENIQVYAQNFMSAIWLGLYGQCPSLHAWIAEHGMRDALRYEQRVLKLLQWRNPRKRWIFKTPDAVRYLPEILDAYPDITFLFTHRDPIKAMSSAVNMFGMCMYVRSDRPFLPGTYEAFARVENSAPMLERVIDWLEEGTIPHRQLHSIHYADLVTDPLAVIDTLYDHHGDQLTGQRRAAVQAFIDSRPRDARPPNVYRTGSAEQVSAERAAFKRYQDYFGVPSEI
jgi:hypothetical protein